MGNFFNSGKNVSSFYNIKILFSLTIARGLLLNKFTSTFSNAQKPKELFVQVQFLGIALQEHVHVPVTKYSIGRLHLKAR